MSLPDRATNESAAVIVHRTMRATPRRPWPQLVRGVLRGDSFAQTSEAMRAA